MTPALFALALIQAPAATQQGIPDSTRVAINRVFATWSASNSPGCAVGVARNGETLFQNGYVRPVFGDTFVGDYLLRFARGKGGKVEGMLMSSGRVRGVRFERTQPK